MKTVTNLLLALSFILGSVQLTAGVEPVLSIDNPTSHSFTLKLDGLQYATCKVLLTDLQGYVLLDEKIEDQDFYHKVYNLKYLPEGTYQIRAENTQKIIFQTFEIRSRSQEIAVQSKREVYKPSIKYNFPYVDLNMLHFERGEAHITFYDSFNFQIHKATIKEKGNIGKRFSLAALAGGPYSMEIRTDDFTHRFSFEVENIADLEKNE